MNRISMGVSKKRFKLKEETNPPFHLHDLESIKPKVIPVRNNYGESSVKTYFSNLISEGLEFPKKHLKGDDKMKFIVKFKGEVMSVKGKEVGLDLIEKIREDAKVDIPVEKFPDTIPGIRSDYNFLFLTEEQAKETGCFKENNTVTVSVLGHFLNEAVELKYHFGETPNGEYLKLYHELNEEKLYEIWKENDFALKLDNAIKRKGAFAIDAEGNIE